MKKGLSLLLSLIMVLGVLTSMPLPASAASEISLSFTLSNDGTYYYISDCSLNASGRLVIPSTYNNKPVKSIGYKAFYDCDDLETIYIPNSVTSIGDYAFSSCSGLTTITIPDSVTSIGKSAFEYCDNIDSVTIGNSVKSIGDYAFSSCSNLHSIAIGSSVASIGNNAFQYCRKISYVYITDIAAWCNVIFEGDYSHPFWYSDTWDYKNSLYINGELVKELVIPDGVTSIGNKAFSSCSGLTSVTIPESVTCIGDGAFSCTNLTSITIPQSVTSIGNYAFSSCSGLTSVTIPENIACIGDGAFSDCTNLTSITIPQSVTRIGNSTFYSCSSLTSVTIPDSVTSIGNYAFKDCNKLKYVFYIGTQEDWLTIDIGSDNSSLIDAKTHYKTSGHIASDWEIDTVATCTKNGLKSKTCSICGNVETETIPAYGHAKSNWITDKKATVNAAGKKHKECTECGETLETAKIAQLKCSKPKLKSIENTEHGVLTKWGKVSGADKYYVYRKTSGGSYSKIGTTSKTYYTDKKAKSGKKYYYIVKAVNEAGSSSSSSSLSKYYLADTTLKTPSSKKSGITLKWSKVTGADGYMVYRKTGSGSYSKIATVKGNSKVTYTDKKAKKGKTYTYKIKVYKSKTYSAYSNAKKIKDKY